MTLKDSIRLFRCKKCGKEYTMFEKANGNLVYFPKFAVWPIHGEFELVEHLRDSHNSSYSVAKELFRGREELIGDMYSCVRG